MFGAQEEPSKSGPSLDRAAQDPGVGRGVAVAFGVCLLVWLVGLDMR